MVKIVVNYSGYLELVVDLPLWKMMEFVSWDDDIPSIGKQNVPHHQSAYQLCMMVPSSYSWFIPSFSHLSISQLNAIANRTGGPIPYDSHFWQMDHHLPSGKRLHSYWKWPFIVDLPIKNGTFIVDLHVPLHVGKITTCSFLYGSHLPTWFSDADRKKNKTWGHKTLFKSHMYSFQSASEINLQFSQKKIWIGPKKKRYHGAILNYVWSTGEPQSFPQPWQFYSSRSARRIVHTPWSTWWDTESPSLNRTSPQVTPSKRVFPCSKCSRCSAPQVVTSLCPGWIADSIKQSNQSWDTFLKCAARRG